MFEITIDKIETNLMINILCQRGDSIQLKLTD